MSRKRFDLCTYLAGGAATSALIVACAIVFASLAAYVGFNGLPIAGAGSDGADVVIAADRATGAERDRAAARRQSAQRRDASAGSRGRAARGAGDAGPATGNAAAATPGEAGTGGSQVASETGGGSTQTAVPAPAPAPAPTPAPAPAPAPGPQGVESLAAEGSGPVQQLIDQVSQQTSIPLDDLTSGITAPVQDALGQLGQQSAGNGGLSGLLDRGD